MLFWSAVAVLFIILGYCFYMDLKYTREYRSANRTVGTVLKVEVTAKGRRYAFVEFFHGKECCIRKPMLVNDGIQVGMSVPVCYRIENGDAVPVSESFYRHRHDTYVGVSLAAAVVFFVALLAIRGVL